MTDPAPGGAPSPGPAHSLWIHARAVLILLLLLVLTAGILYPLAIGGLGVAVHRNVVNTTNNSSGSATVRPLDPSGTSRQVLLSTSVPGTAVRAPVLPYGERPVSFPPTLLYSGSPPAPGRTVVTGNADPPIVGDPRAATGGI